MQGTSKTAPEMYGHALRECGVLLFTSGGLLGADGAVALACGVVLFALGLIIER